MTPWFVLLMGCPGPTPDTTDTSLDTGLAECSEYDEASSVAVLEPNLVEASGLVLGKGDVLWSHNDSGDSARIFAIGLDGSPQGVAFIDGAAARDWEDIARLDTEDLGSVLVLADLGDNSGSRTDASLVLFAEPDAPGRLATTTVTDAWTIAISYEEGPQDVEAISVDPVDHSLVILSKSVDGSLLFTAPTGWWNERSLTLGAIATVPFGTDLLPGAPTVTGMDISATGDAILVRTYSGAWLFRRPPGPIEDAFNTPPCEAPAALEQGEAIAFVGADYVTLPEGASPLLVRYTPE